MSANDARLGVDQLYQAAEAHHSGVLLWTDADLLLKRRRQPRFRPPGLLAQPTDRDNPVTQANLREDPADGRVQRRAAGKPRVDPFHGGPDASFAARCLGTLLRQLGRCGAGDVFEVDGQAGELVHRSREERVRAGRCQSDAEHLGTLRRRLNDQMSHLQSTDAGRRADPRAAIFDDAVALTKMNDDLERDRWGRCVPAGTSSSRRTARCARPGRRDARGGNGSRSTPRRCR